MRKDSWERESEREREGPMQKYKERGMRKERFRKTDYAREMRKEERGGSSRKGEAEMESQEEEEEEVREMETRGLEHT